MTTYIVTHGPSGKTRLVEAANQVQALRQRVEQHNADCIAQCEWRQDNGDFGHLCLAMKRIGRHGCTDCPRDYLIDAAMQAEAQEA